MPGRVTIGTRGSKLALWQAHWVKDALTAQDGGLQVEITIIKTKGDKILSAAFPVSGRNQCIKMERLQGDE